MTTITREDRFEQLQQEIDYLESIIDDVQSIETRVDAIETEQVTQNNRLDNIEIEVDTLTLASLNDVNLNDPLTIGQVFAYGGNGWGNYTIDISTQQPIVDLDN